MIGAIVLAAGTSRRFGDDKRKATLPSGRMVIQQSIETALASFSSVLLVLRQDDADFAAKLSAAINDPRMTVLLAPDSALGMGHSLANAVAAVRDWDAAFVCLADMPHISVHTLDLLKSAFIEHQGEHPIIVPDYQGRWGHPVGFHSAYFDDIAALTGDQGARPVINNHEPRVIHIEVNDPGVLQDIDTPADL